MSSACCGAGIVMALPIIAFPDIFAMVLFNRQSWWAVIAYLFAMFMLFLAAYKFKVTNDSKQEVRKEAMASQ